MPLPPSIARFNRRVTNHVTAPFADRLPGFGVVTHRGRVSGRTFHTPVNLFRRPGGYDFALTYGQGDWVKNVMHAGGTQVITHGREHRVTNPRIVSDRESSGVPHTVRGILHLLQAYDEFLRVDEADTEMPDDLR